MLVDIFGVIFDIISHCLMTIRQVKSIGCPNFY